MKLSHIACLSFAAIVGLAAPIGVAAQDTASDRPGRVTVSGCVEQAQRTGSLAGTGVGTTATPNTAAIEANSAKLVDAFLLTDATTAGDTGAAATPQGTTGERTTYALEGREQELTAHKGHRVEIAGTLAPPRSSGRGATSDATAAGIRRVQVESVKMLAADCTPKKPSH